jgi:hypothetical protein
MANTLTEHFDSGAQGAAVTTASTAFAAVTLVGTAAVTYDSTNAIAGGRGAKMVVGNATTAGDVILRHDVGSLVTTRYARAYYTFSVVPSAVSVLMEARIAAGTTRAQVRLSTAGKLVLTNQFTTVATSTLTLATGQPFRIEWELINGTRQTLRIFTGTNVNGTTPDETITGTFNTGTFERILFGAIDGYVGTLWADEIAVDDTTWPGTAVTTAPPTSAEAWELKFEGGTAGAAATAANTGTSVDPVGPGTSTFVSGVLEGLGLKVSVAANQTEQLRHDNGAGLVSSYNYRVYMKAATPVTFPRFPLQVTAAGTIRAQVGIGIDGTLRLRNGTTTVATSTMTIPPNALVRVGWSLDNTAGTQSARIYVGANVHGTTPDETVTGAFNTGTFDRFNFGINDAETEAWDVLFDNVAGNAAQQVGPASVSSTPAPARAFSGVALMVQATDVIVTPPPPPPPPPPPVGSMLAGAIVGARAGTEPGVPSVVKSADQELARLESLIGVPLQIRRTYNGNIPTSFANTAANADVGKRASSISVKSDPTQTAAGAFNTPITTFVKSIPKGHKVYLTWQHEPENPKKAFTPATIRAAGNMFAKTVKAARVAGQDITVVWCLMGWTFSAASGRNPLDWYWGDDAVELVAPDPYMYNETAYVPFTGTNVGALQAYNFAKAHGKRFGINEWGSLDHPNNDRPRFIKEADTWLRGLTNPRAEFSCWYHDFDQPPDAVGCWVDTLQSSPTGTRVAGNGIDAFSQHVKDTVP